MGKKIASLYAEIGGDNTKLKGALKDSKSAVSSFGSELKKMLVPLGAFAAGVTVVNKLGQAIKYSMAQAAEAEQVQTQLYQVIRSTGGAAGYTAAEVLSMSDQLSHMTGVNDEAITKANALMLTFTQIKGETLPQATEAAMNLSTALGQDLQQSVVQVGKALNDPSVGLTALKRVGVSFSESQKAVIDGMVETGNIAGAQKIILEELNKEFGGQAQANLYTYAGALQAVSTSAGNLGEAMGKGLTDKIKGFNLGVADLLDLAGKWIQKNYVVGTSLSKTSSGMVVMNRALSENTAAMSDNEKGYTQLAVEGEITRREQQAMLDLTLGMGTAFYVEGEELDKLTKKYIESQNAIKAQSEAGGETITKQTNIIETQYRKQEDSMNALMQSLEPTKDALQEFLTGKLEGYYPGGERYSELGGVIDTLFDTTILKTQAATEEAKKLWAEYQKTGDEAALIAGLQDVMAKDFIDTSDVDTQTDAVKRFADAIARLTGLPHNIVFKITAQIMGDLGGGASGRVQGGLADEERRTGKDINGNGIIGGAGGLRNYTVPPGFTGDSYPVMAQTGEHVTVEPVGERGRYGSGGSLTNYGHITVVSNPSSTIDLLQSLQGAMA